MTIASHFEAKKHAYRQTQDGVVISFVVHPNDLNAALAVAPLGTRYMVAVAQIGDDGMPVETPEASVVEPASTQDAAGGAVASPRLSAPASGARGGWYGLLPSARASILCKDPDFRAWAEGTFKTVLENEGEADTWLKDKIDTHSKACLNPDNKPHHAAALRKFGVIERQYREARGLETAEAR